MIRKNGSRGPCSDACGAGDAPGERTAFARLPSEDQFLIGVYRWLCLSASERSNMGWETAVNRCEERLGIHNGPSVLARIIALMRAIKRDRGRPFRFYPPDCPDCSQLLSDDEQTLVALVQSARRLDPIEVLSCAVDLTGASRPSNVVRASVALGAALQRCRAHEQTRMLRSGRLN